MNANELNRHEQAAEFFHLQRELYSTNKNHTKQQDVADIEENFERWIADPLNQEAYSEINRTWNLMRPLETAEESLLKERGIDLSTEKDLILKKMKIVGLLALVDLALSFAFPPLSVFEPILLGGLIYLGFKYYKRTRNHEQVVPVRK